MNSPSTGSSVPLVSVVIPTCNRTELLLRAIKSVIEQTWVNLEIIVVVDGHDENTTVALQNIKDPRVRSIMLETPGGSNRARNLGAQSAFGTWVAFLDDDDQWMPAKLERQFQTANQTGSSIVSCRFIASFNWGDVKWPRTLPSAGQPIGDYLYCRRSLTDGEALLLTSTLFVSREVIKQTEFDPELRRLQDADWALRATNECKTQVVFVPEPLMIWSPPNGRATISNKHDWVHLYGWARTRRHLLSRRAYSGVLLTTISSVAARQRAYLALPRLLFEACLRGDPSFLQLIIFAGMWLVPQGARVLLKRQMDHHESESTRDMCAS